MAIKSAPYYWVECDCCRTRCDYYDYAAWADPDQALFHMDQDAFIEINGKELCSFCWCWPEDLPDYPGDDAWKGSDDPVARPGEHPHTAVVDGRKEGK